MQPRLVITLIHGTYARGAEWTQPTSDFALELQERLHCPSLITRVDWSGENSAFDRVDGGRIVEEHLNELKRLYAGAKQYVVAHSHGGNVALYAATQVDGIACLATPFLHAKARDTELLTYEALQRGLFGLFCLVTFVFGIVSAFSLLAWIGIEVLLIVICAVVAAIIGSISRVALARSSELATVFTARVPPGVRFCTFRVTGDEASASLATGQLLAWASVKLSSHFAKSKELRFLKEPWRDKQIPRVFWIVPIIGMLSGLASAGLDVPFLLTVAKFSVTISVLVIGGLKTRFLDNMLYGASFALLWIATFVGVFLIGTLPPTMLVDHRLARWTIGLSSFSRSSSTPRPRQTEGRGRCSISSVMRKQID